MARKDVRVDRGIYWRHTTRNKTLWIQLDVMGHRVRKRIESGSITEARAELARLRTKGAMGEALVEPTRMSFLAFSEHYRAAFKHQKYYNWKRSAITRATGRWGGRSLTQLTARLLEGYQSSQLTAGYSPAYINREINLIRHMLRKAVDWNMAPEYAITELRKVKTLPERNQRLRYLSLEEIARLLRKATGRLRVFLVVALYTGMRKNEILTLRWKQIDRKAMLVHLEQGDTKTGKRRSIPLHPEALEAIDSIVRHLEATHVFWSEKKGPKAHMTMLYCQLRYALKQAKIKDFRLHDCRHTFASHLVMNGTPLAVVKELLGHANITMTLRYAHLAPAAKVDAIAGLYKPKESPAKSKSQKAR